MIIASSLPRPANWTPSDRKNANSTRLRFRSEQVQTAELSQMQRPPIRQRNTDSIVGSTPLCAAAADSRR